MANIRTFFIGRSVSLVKHSAKLECVLEGGEIVITVDDGNGNSFISLDKSTAIKLAKKLRTEINRIGQGGANE